MTNQRTSLLLDPELVARAAEALGTSSKTETVRAALERAVRREHLQSLIEWELPDSATDELEAQRRTRDFS